MKAIVQWAIRNSPAMNTLMISVLAVGILSMTMLRREVFPEFQLERILVTVPYPGASPSEVEEGICLKIEEAVRSISGIKKQTSVAAEGSGTVVLELETGTDVQKILNEVESEIDRIPSFPELAEDPEVKQVTLREPAIQIAVIGTSTAAPDWELQLRETAELVRKEILMLPNVSQAEINGSRDYQIDIEIPEATLRRYGLTLQQVAQIVRRENIELPGGDIKTEAEQVRLRGMNKQVVGTEIARIPVVTQDNGVVLTIGDLGVVRDEFADTTAISRIDGKPALTITVQRTSKEDLLAIAEEVNGYVETRDLGGGIELKTWNDMSIDVRDRLEMLTRNGLQGLFLVFIVLAVFLEIRLAFWVALGIPVSILGSCSFLLMFDQTLNMISMFSFLTALGIVVDDAIVVGENIYAHRQAGKGRLQAAIDGTVEVIPSVTASVMTTVIAFVPMLFVSGVMGKFIAVMPVAIIAMLLISLVESMIILPCHLAHSHSGDDPRTLTFQARDWSRRMPFGLRILPGFIIIGLAFIADQFLYPLRKLGALGKAVNKLSGRCLGFVITRLYLPTLKGCISNPVLVASAAFALLLVSLGLIRAGVVPWTIFPKLDNKMIQATVVYPDGTPGAVTNNAAKRLEESIVKINERYTERGMPLITLLHRNVGQVSSSTFDGNQDRQEGSHIARVTVELVDTADRSVKSQQVITEWRDEVGDIPGVESLTFGSPQMGPGGKQIEFKLIAEQEDFDALVAATDECKAQLRKYPGVFDVADDSQPGKWEFQLRVKDRARAMGIPLADLAETVRASYYGEEVMRLQRGRHEVKLMVRYPAEERRSMANFEEIRIRSDDGAERPLTELAAVTVDRGTSEINRVEQMRSITITADVDEELGNSSDIVNSMQSEVMPVLLEDFPQVRVRWEGQREQSQESLSSLFVGFLVCLAAMFGLLTVEFRSYIQPLIILALIPFGAIGAIAGHAFMGLPLTMFSLFGLVALTGVVVNDSIVLVDFINHRLADGMPLREALVDAGRRRFRPVFLTSVTTVAGLLPILLETSFQAQILIPMATSLCFGLMSATFLVLFLVPTFYMIYQKVIGKDVAEEQMPSDQREMKEDQSQIPVLT